MQCEIQNLSEQPIQVSMVDGLQNILPASLQRPIQTDSSNLADAYKWTELDEPTGIALFTLYSGISDRPDPLESLKANVTFCLGLEGQNVLLSSEQLKDFHLDRPLQQETHKRGVRGAYMVK